MTYPPSPRTDAGDTTALAHPYFAGLPSPDSADFESLCRFCEDHRITVLASLPWVAAEVAALGGFAAMLRWCAATAAAGCTCRAGAPRVRCAWAWP
ncbi:hypothetical protein, partial [Lysobacter capsici]|uniref:hypothetical protein n=1 Tax=Lysobacter capsici TaxID=435897 RepID=UPI00398CFB93